jgi:hypothetical protein
MLKYETFLVRGSGEVHDADFKNGDEYLHGIGGDCVFGVGEDNKPLFIVNTTVTQTKLFDGTMIHSMQCESIFALAGSKQDFTDAPFEFFEKLLSLGLAHARGLFAFTVMHGNYGFSTLPDKDYSADKDKIDKKKMFFIERYFKER